MRPTLTQGLPDLGSMSMRFNVNRGLFLDDASLGVLRIGLRGLLAEVHTFDDAIDLQDFRLAFLSPATFDDWWRGKLKTSTFTRTLVLTARAEV